MHLWQKNGANFFIEPLGTFVQLGRWPFLIGVILLKQNQIEADTFWRAIRLGNH